MSLGTTLQNISRSQIAVHGQAKTVKRLGRATDITVTFLIQPLTARDVQRMRLEGNLNLLNAEWHTYLCAGDADVLENDRIVHDGMEWLVVAVSDQFEQGVNIARQCTCSRRIRSA